MIARFEKKTLSGETHVSAHSYGNLHNLPHWHVENELIFVPVGEAEVVIGSNLFRISGNKCVFVRGGEVHYIKSAGDSVVCVLKIAPELLHSSFGGTSLCSPLIEGNYGLRKAFEEIALELGGREEYCQVIADSIMLGVIAKIFRGEKTECASDESRSTDKYKKLLNIISEKYAYITFEEAAEFMCLSQPYFSKYFRKMSGMTFTEYLNVVRVNNAVKLLSAGDMPVTEIALQTGFGTIRSFNRVFKALTGYSPRALPQDFVFLRAAHSSEDDEGFDPTLSAVMLV